MFAVIYQALRFIETIIAEGGEIFFQQKKIAEKEAWQRTNESEAKKAR